MIKKQGITVTVMVTTIIILMILAGTITITTYSAINFSRLSAWASEMMYIQDVVDEKLKVSSATDYVLDSITIDVSGLDSSVLQEQFYGESITVDNTVQLMILDLGKLKITNTVYGKLETSTDVYAVSTNTGRVYYVQGIDIDKETYYTLTDSLKNSFSIDTSSDNLSSVVFMPSKIGYTNEPITVTVKLPNTYTNIVISTSNNEINIGSQTLKDSVYEYTINDNIVTGNYTITVSYNNGTQSLTSTYEVNGYDATAPVIQELTDENFLHEETETTVISYLVNITATDESGIKVMKYTIGTVEETEAQEYFKNNGNPIVDKKINLDREVTEYTIYVEDDAGNFSILTFDKNDYISTEVELP